MKKILFILFAASLLCGCDPIQPSDEKPSEPKSLSATGYHTGWLVTVKHDDHLFIVEGKWQKGAILHHPDCPCQKPQLSSK